MMRRPRNRYERTTQVLRWLLSEFKFTRRLKLRWLDKIPGDEESPKGYHGFVTEDDDGSLVIYLCGTANRGRSESVEALIHEATHAYLWDQGLGYKHGPVFWKHYGRMHDAYDHHGESDSMAFSPE